MLGGGAVGTRTLSIPYRASFRVHGRGLSGSLGPGASTPPTGQSNRLQVPEESSVIIGMIQFLKGKNLKDAIFQV